MIREQLNAEPQLVRSSFEASKAIDQWEPATGYWTWRGSRSFLRQMFGFPDSTAISHASRRRVVA